MGPAGPARNRIPWRESHPTDRKRVIAKADPSRSSPGSGLGLGIAMENARLLGGDIAVWSEVGVGSRFTLRLPLKRVADAPEGVTQPLPTGEDAVSGGLDDEAQVEERGGRR